MNIYTIITPEGHERVIGVFKTESGARRACKRQFSSDWLGLAAWPLCQRAPNSGEKPRFGDKWEG